MNFYTNTNSKPVIIGIDHGYGNIKTAHTCFKTGVSAYDKEPTFKSNLLIYEGRFYLIGEDHKEFLADKMMDEDYYILTLAAVARELNIRRHQVNTLRMVQNTLAGGDGLLRDDLLHQGGERWG